MVFYKTHFIRLKNSIIGTASITIMLLQVERKVSLIIDRQGVNLNGGLILKSYLFRVGFTSGITTATTFTKRRKMLYLFSFTKNIQKSTV